MRILLDTNVLIAALIAKGACAEVVEQCVVNHTIVSSEYILGELADKLLNKFRYDETLAEEAITLFRGRAEIVSPDPLSVPISRDPDDDHVIAAASAARCDLIVTGDKDLLVLEEYKGIQIITPRQFLDLP